MQEKCIVHRVATMGATMGKTESCVCILFVWYVGDCLVFLLTFGRGLRRMLYFDNLALSR